MAGSDGGMRPIEVPQLVNNELTVASSHPTRIKALEFLRERDASAGEIGKAIGRTLRHVKYHLDQMAKVNLVKVVSERAAHGGRVKEKIWRYVDAPYMDQEQWLRAAEEEQIAITVKALRLASEDIAEAVLGGTINWPGEEDAEDYAPNHISRSSVALDRTGWNQMVELFKNTLDRAIEINRQASERALETEEELVPGRVALLQFRSPHPTNKESGATNA
jgi:DNA-binding transcriptional ArsR family regulator